MAWPSWFKPDKYLEWHTSEELKGDKEVVLAAVNQNGWALQFASEELKGDKEVVLASISAVNFCGEVLEYASEELKGDKEVVMAAVNQDGLALEFASEELKGDKEVVMAAVNQDGRALKFASNELRGDKEVGLATANQNFFAVDLALGPLRWGLRAYVFNLLDTYTVPSSVFLGTVLCGAKLFTARAPSPAEAFTISMAGSTYEEGEDVPAARRTRTHVEANPACLLPMLGPGNDTTVTLMKKIAAFAGVQCQELCGVPWSHVIKVATHFPCFRSRYGT